MAAFLRIYEPLDALTNVPMAHRARWRALAASDQMSGETRDETLDGPRDETRHGPRYGAQRTRQRLDLAARERAAALRAASALPPRLVSDLDMIGPDGEQLAGELLTPVADDGIVRVCPADLASRALFAVEKLRRVLPPELLSAFFPQTVIAEATSRLAQRAELAGRTGRTEHEADRISPHVRSSNWYIPLCWFAAFRLEQQVGTRPAGGAEVAEGPNRTHDAESAEGGAGAEGGAVAQGAQVAPGESGGQGLASDETYEPVRYLAPMADARRCIARALAAARRVTTDLMPSSDLEELGRWLEEFHARSVVELDYGGLACLADRTDGSELAEPCVGSVATAIANIRSDDVDLVSLGLEQLAQVQRLWAAVRLMGRAS